MTTITEANVRENVVFLQISLSRMGDKRGVSSEEIEVDADKDLIKVRKVIFKSPYFDRIKNLDSEIRRYVRSQCFPFESGLHLTPLAMVNRIDTNLLSYRIRRDQYIVDFAEEFPILISTFDERLRRLYNINDYNVGDVTSQFSMNWNFIQLKTPDTLSASCFIEERRKLESRMNEAFEGARLILRETCLELVTHLRQALSPDSSGSIRRLSSAAVNKLKEFVETFDLRNITNDVMLTQYINQLKLFTSDLDAESLRTMDGFRNRIRTELTHVEESLSAAIVVLPARRIRGL